jgi:polyphosphate kinase
MLIDAGIRLHKYYLDISRDEQRKRLDDRKIDPLKQWKTSPIDRVAIKHWDAYTEARNEMLARTHHASAPWRVVRADDKREARINLIRDLLSHLPYEQKTGDLLIPDPSIVFEFEHVAIEQGLLAR